MIHSLRLALAAALLLAASLLPGCTGVLSDIMVDAPGEPHAPTADELNDVPNLSWLGVDQTLRVPVGPPDAVLTVAVIEPPADVSPRGTVIVLHGFRTGMFWQLGAAREIAEAGYRVAAVELRGHGDSTGGHYAFGVFEKRDVAQVIDELERRDLVAGRLGVWGISYGAATAIQLAAMDDRVAAVVAVSPFSSMREVTPRYMRIMVPVVTWFVDDATFQRAIDEAGTKGGFDPDEADTAAAIAKTDTPVLILHGTWDALVPVEHSKRIHAARPQGTELVLIDGVGHIGMWMDFGKDVRDRTRDWFEKTLAVDRVQ